MIYRYTIRRVIRLQLQLRLCVSEQYCSRIDSTSFLIYFYQRFGMHVHSCSMKEDARESHLENYHSFTDVLLQMNAKKETGVEENNSLEK